MLLNNFFSINTITSTGTDINASLEINAGHKIFEGHFPGQPVVPGVCMMQMVKEIVEKIIEKKTGLIKAHDIKFMAIIDPSQNNIINATLKYITGENGDLQVAATFFKEELVHFKFKGIFTVEQIKKAP
jgi:3-hydroxyacyl-[acyl-carrier-protein] dehydratase